MTQPNKTLLTFIVAFIMVSAGILFTIHVIESNRSPKPVSISDSISKMIAEKDSLVGNKVKR